MFPHHNNKTIPFLGAIQSYTDLQQVLDFSETMPVGIFKHDPQSSISLMGTNFLNRNWEIETHRLQMYYLDAHAYRSASTIVERTIGIKHDAPQIIVLYKNNVIYHAVRSHISQAELSEILDKHYPILSEENPVEPTE
jgi:bacillithiol system protein YtxJ